MELILWRHAEAEDEGLGLKDFDRALTRRGLDQADRMGKWLRKRLPDTHRIIVSPALRTQQTASALGLPFDTVKELAPGAGADAVLRAAGWPDGGDPCVLVVGHQPTLGLVASRLLSGRLDAWAVHKGAVWWLRSRERNGRTEVELVAAQNPDCI